MDYPTTPALADRYTALIKTQWDHIHNPQSTTGLFDGMEEGASFFDGSWIILDEKHTRLFNHMFSNNNSTNHTYIDKVDKAKARNSEVKYIDLNYSEKEYKEWVNQWKVRTASSDEVVERIILKIKGASGGKKIDTLNLATKGIYVGKFKIDGVEFPVAIYSEKSTISNLKKVQVAEISDLEKEENRKHLRIEETNIKYLILAFYEDNNPVPSLLIQVEKFGIDLIEKTKVLWLNELKVLKRIVRSPTYMLPLRNNEYRGYSSGYRKPTSATYGCTRYNKNYDCDKNEVYGDKPHHGVDLKAEIGDSCFAVADGVVTFVGNINGYGKCIAILCDLKNKFTDKEEKLYTFYAHLSRITVKHKQKVEKGDFIGEAGVTGAEFLLSRPNEIHLHFEIIERWWPKGFTDRKDPENYINILKPKN